ncbi:MAG: signal peptidase I [Phycisphaerae bacterium]
MGKANVKTSRDIQTDYNAVRDMVESIWIAIVLAFVLRAFFIEAFIIPTGSMAPRLMGEHWDLQCPSCGYEYAYGWPSNIPQPPRSQKRIPEGARCPNCGFTYTNRQTGSKEQFVNAGDRVLVMKYLYDFRDPQPWDVVVFRNPQNNRENYIKRLVGLPGESIEIVHGDIFYKSGPPDSSDPWRIRRKPKKAQDAMWQVVFDNDYRPADDPSGKGWGKPTGEWDLAKFDGRRFEFAGTREGTIEFMADESAFLPRYGYNLPRSERDFIDDVRDICTDLKLAVTFVPKAEDARVSLELSSFEDRFRAEVGADGTIAVKHSPRLDGDEWETWPAKGIERMAVGRGHEIALTNVDFRLTLWVDDKPVFESTDDQYPHATNAHDYLTARMADASRTAVPRPEVRIGASGGASELLHVRLMRDVYYTSGRTDSISDTALCEFAKDLGARPGEPGWGSMGNPIYLERHPEDKDLDPFFVLGDNSPQSLDGRCWTKAAPTLRLWKHPDWNHAEMKPSQNREDALYELGTVPRYNLTGRALFVYWPSGFRIPGLEGLPIIPNVGRMRLIR